ncbi:MAG TPA: hypothetical protein PKD91_00295 [Bacteroidia bacterium]|nr:hypothetical protein [Bacteroidia bacterium]
MTTGQKLLLLLIPLTHVWLSLKGTRILLKSTILTAKRRQYNIILLWTIPIVWYLLVRTIHKRTPGSHEVPVKNDVSSNNLFESGVGAPGAGIRNR